MYVPSPFDDLTLPPSRRTPGSGLCGHWFAPPTHHRRLYVLRCGLLRPAFRLKSSNAVAPKPMVLCFLHLQICLPGSIPWIRKMKLLLCIHLPLLPLEALHPSWSKRGAHAVVQGGKVIVASREAINCGVRIAMRSGGVNAVAPDTKIFEKCPIKEQQALDAIAMALLQYTPEVAFADDFSIIMDVTAREALIYSSSSARQCAGRDAEP